MFKHSPGGVNEAVEDGDAVSLAGGGQGGPVPLQVGQQGGRRVAGGGPQVGRAGHATGDGVVHDRDAMAELIGFSTRGRM